MLKTQDKFLFFVSLTLILIGLLAIASSSWHEALRLNYSPWFFILRHLIIMSMGIPILLLLSFVHYRWYQKLAWPLFFISLGLLLITAKWGLVSGGSRRWLDFGLIQFQPSEFAKVSSIILLTKVFYEKEKRLLGLIFVGLIVFLILRQPDLGTSILLVSGIIAVLFASGLNLMIFLTGLGSLGYLLKLQIQHTAYQLSRIKFWLDPYSDPLGHGYNLIQSQHAIGAGGLLGNGFGGSLQKLGSLPIAHADFIFSILAEELGFLGTLAVLLVFLAWIFLSLEISFRIEDKFAKILGFSLTTIFSFQVLINIGVASGLFPITGMTLPFISFGGTSFLTTCIITGIILNISRNLPNAKQTNQKSI
jgi:cell division protein FtsW